MKKTTFILMFFASGIILFFSCATPKIMYDFDNEANFSSYKTFAFYPNLQLYMNQLDSRRVIQQVENAMLLKGFKRSSSPDVFVNVVSEQFETPSNNSIGIGIGTSGRNAGVGVSGGIPIRSNSMTQLFTVDLIDVANDLLIWQAKYEGKFNRSLASEAKNEFFGTTFEKIFSGYPSK